MSFSVIPGALMKDPVSVCVSASASAVHTRYMSRRGGGLLPRLFIEEAPKTRYTCLQMLLWHRVCGALLSIPRQAGTVRSRSRRGNWTAR